MKADFPFKGNQKLDKVKLFCKTYENFDEKAKEVTVSYLTFDYLTKKILMVPTFNSQNLKMKKFQ